MDVAVARAVAETAAMAQLAAQLRLHLPQRTLFRIFPRTPTPCLFPRAVAEVEEAVGGVVVVAVVVEAMRQC